MALPAFHNVDFPLNLREGARVRFRFATDIIRTRGQQEQRRFREFDGHWEADIAPMITTQAELTTLQDFWRARQGIRYSFRFRNPIDNTATAVQVGTGDNSVAQFQLMQAYASGVAGDTYTARRIVSLPVAGSVTATLNGTPRTHISVDTETGVLTFGVLAHQADLVRDTGVDKITSDSALDWSAFGVLAGDLVTVAGSASHDGTYTVAGFADANTSITLTGADFSTPENDVTINALFPPPTGSGVRWSGTFDVAMRFRAMRMQTRLRDLLNDLQTDLTLIEDRAYATAAIGIAEDTLPTTTTARLPTTYSEGAEIGPEHAIEIIPSDVGDEDRIATGTSRLAGQIPYLTRTPAEVAVLLAWFLCRKGRYTSFNVSDLTDNATTQAETLGTGDDTTVDFELIKTYTSGGATETRRIRRPLTGAVSVYIDDVLQGSGYTVDLETGVVPFDTAPAGGEVISAEVSEFDVLMRFDTDVFEVTLSAAGAAYDVTGLDLVEVSEAATGIAYLGGSTGLTTATPSGCAVRAYAPPAVGVPFASFRADALRLSDFPGTDAIHKRLRAYEAVTLALVAQNFEAGTVLEIPSGEASAPGPYFQGDYDGDTTHFANIRIRLQGNSAGNSLGILARATVGGAAISLSGDPCNPDTRDYTFSSTLTADAQAIKHGDTSNGLGTLAAGKIADLAVIIVTVSISTQRIYVSGTAHGTARFAGNPSALSTFAWSQVKTDPSTGCWSVNTKTSPVWVGDDKITHLRHPLVGGIPGQLSETTLNDSPDMDLYELLIERHRGHAAELAAIAKKHLELCAYFYRRYALGLAPFYAPEDLLGWWTSDSLEAVAPGEEIETWPSVTGTGGASLVEFYTGSGVNQTPKRADAATPPALPAGARLITFDGVEPVIAGGIVTV